MTRSLTDNGFIEQPPIDMVKMPELAVEQSGKL